MLVREAMTRSVVTVPWTAGVAAASQTLIEHGFTALPVVDDDGRLVGIVTEADLIRDTVPVRSWPSGRLPPLTRPPGATVAQVMTTPVESLTPGADIADAARMMLDERIRCLPVVDGVGLVGILTRRDLLRAALAHEDAELRRSILSQLHALDPRDRWEVDVAGGVAVIGDHVDDAGEHTAAGVIAAAVPGVDHAEVRYRTTDPF